MPATQLRETLAGKISRYQLVYDGCKRPIAPAGCRTRFAAARSSGSLIDWPHRGVEGAGRSLLKRPPNSCGMASMPSSALSERLCSASTIMKLGSISSVSDLGLSANIKFLGFRSDIACLLAESTLVVHASTLGEPFWSGHHRSDGGRQAGRRNRRRSSS